jgi:hypothetical protein
METRADRLLGRTADEWSSAAMRWYLEEHQGCPCCQGRHCVFRSQWGARVEYHCNACDFSAAYDTALKRCTASRGERPQGLGMKLCRDSAFDVPSPLAQK